MHFTECHPKVGKSKCMDRALAMNQGVQKGTRLWTESGRQLLSDLEITSL